MCVVCEDACQALNSDEAVTSKEKWMLRGKNDAAMQEILSGLINPLKLEMTRYTDAWSMWKGIKKHCSEVSSEMINELRNDIFNPKFGEGDNWDDYYQGKVEAYHMLLSTDAKIPERELALAVVSGIVHPRYMGMRITAQMERWDDLEELTRLNRLMASAEQDYEEHTKTHQLETKPNETRTALVLDSGETRSSKRRRIECTYCSKIGLAGRHRPGRCWADPKSPRYRGDEWVSKIKAKYGPKAQGNEKYQAQANVALPRPGLKKHHKQ